MDRVKLKVLGLSYSMSQTSAYALILSDESDAHRIPIVIGTSEAQSIALQLEKIQSKRPLTHDLMKSLVDAVGAVLKEVFICRLESGIFYSELFFDTGKSVIKLDSRTSDAISLALRCECPIYTTPEIIAKAGIVVVHEEGTAKEPNVVRVTRRTEDDMSGYSEQELVRMLNDAVEKEEYERASKLRDAIRKKNPQ